MEAYRKGEGGEVSDQPNPTTDYNLRIVAAAKAFCDAHREDYDQLKTSDSMDADAEFLLLFQAIEGEPESKTAI